MHEQDWFEGVRERLWRLVHATGTVGAAQYACTVPDVEAFEGVLHELGFVRNRLAYLKRNRDGDWSAGSWAYRDSFWSRWQYYVALFADGDVYCHRELSWRRHPIEHVRRVRVTPAPQWLRQRLDRAGVAYAIRSVGSRRSSDGDDDTPIEDSHGENGHPSRFRTDISREG